MSQYNGMVERANQKFIEMDGCMFLHSRVVPEWWGEAVISAADTTNQLFRISLFQMHIPNEAFSQIESID
jgi:hypothetical protein